MGDDLGDEWWSHEGKLGDSGAEENEEIEKPTDSKPEIKDTKIEKRKRAKEKEAKPIKKKKIEQKAPTVSEQKEKEPDSDKPNKPKRKRKKKKKTITDVLASEEVKPGCAADLQSVVTKYFTDKCSVIELEELQLKDSCFLTCNDLTHSLSSYLKQICPKWAKIHKHTEKSSAAMLIVCSSALRTIELIKQLTTFKGDAKVLKLFAKHIKIDEQIKLLQKGVTHIGVGTPGRLSALIEKEGLNLRSLRYVILDWNWRDQKLRRMVDIPEIKLDFMNMLGKIIKDCKEFKIGLF